MNTHSLGASGDSEMGVQPFSLFLYPKSSQSVDPSFSLFLESVSCGTHSLSF